MVKIEKRVQSLISDLTAKRSLTPEFIQAEFQRNEFHKVSEKQLMKATLKVVGTFRTRGQMGRFRAAILAGTTILGVAFSTAIERSGALLSDNMPPEKFRNFLVSLQVELRSSSHLV